ncbi:MAG TPA: MaoC/PaaZ C-terminal domain-containing protein [Intrasporangium sp.]|uniref:MaoC family dehydratase n=1 Tax=Intrasporangium sp. TaxID=1925024 RepID=UPI002D78DF26|nr:MaoC/PaaZ C-terminal domain-containing protein [Intrasporangium sp.]HET7397522.1 MaoC/PaaZ C-terminal domain-containing protein [Intrasporangium sp.]
MTRSSTTLPDRRAERHDVHVDAGHVARYSRLCGFPVRDELPMPYPHLLAFPLQLRLLAQRDFPLPVLGALHVRGSITVTRALRLQDPLDVAVHARDLRPHRRGTQVDLVSEVSTGGEVAWRGVSTYLARGPEHPDVPADDSPEPPPDAPPAGPRWRLGQGTGRAYAAVSGDWNPIHVHPLGARAFGFPSAIAHGMYTYARVLADLAPRLPAEGLTSTVWFRRPVPLPSSVRLRTAFAPGRTLSVVEAERGSARHAVVENTW